MPGIGSPPVAVKYTSVAFRQENSPAILKLPFESVVTVLVSRGVAYVSSPLVPTAYSSIVAFEIGCEPPRTVPLAPAIERTELVLDEPHPARKTTPIIEAASEIRIGTTYPP